MKKQPKMQSDEFNLEHKWLDFAAHTFTRKVPQVQYDEMKKAFYAGSLVAFIFTMQDLPEYTELEALEALNKIKKQLDVYREGLRNEI